MIDMNAWVSDDTPMPEVTEHAMDIERQELAQAATHRSVYVYQVPVRIWHWTNALAIVVLAVTGWLIASPLPTPVGEASDHYMMGYIRFTHFAAGYVLAIGLLGRTYWAMVGNIYAKELYWVPLFQLEYWKDVWAMMKWYAFASPRPSQYIGHNPLARFAMFFLFLAPTTMMVLTGFALYAEGQQAGSWFEGIFGWVIPLFGQSQDVHTWHHLGMWGLLCFVLVHVYAAVREEILGRSSMVSTMLSGWRTFKD
ncbi:Ni/Fe-hydrogenase, b-type cytochrome subunit [Burkholderiales bacterium JOSHI_001]|nr:Ni/Fe-hydrogenase, b-type cytochrome subunit [Burkholderiales bacterium JOSHI_001]